MVFASPYIAVEKAGSLEPDGPMTRDPKTLVSNYNGGKSRAGEKGKNPFVYAPAYRDPKKRKLESLKRSVNRKVDNLEHDKNDRYLHKCKGEYRFLW